MKKELIQKRLKELMELMITEGYATPELINNPTALFILKELAKTQLELAELKRDIENEIRR
jgi:hypothetical protein